MDRDWYDDSPMVREDGGFFAGEEVVVIPDEVADRMAAEAEQRRSPAPSPAQEAKPVRKRQPRRPVPKPKLRTYAEVLAMPVTSYRVEGLIPKRGVGQIYGDSGCGKSFTVGTMLSRIVEGRDLCGRKTKPCPCFHFHLEGVGYQPKRLAADAKWRREMGWDKLSGKLFYWMEPFSFDDRQIAEAVEVIREHTVEGEGCVIVIDTQAQASAGVQENDTAAMTTLLSKARQFARAVDGVLVLVHHCGKNPSLGGRGSSAQRADFDFQIEVRKDGDTIVWQTAKERDEADDQCVRFKLKVYPSIVKDEDGEWQSSCVAVPETDLPEDERKELKTVAPKGKGSKLAPSVLFALKVFNAAIHEHGKAGWLDIDKFREAFMEQYEPPSDDPKKAGQNARGAFSRAVRDLQNKGFIRKDKGRLQNLQRDE